MRIFSPVNFVSPIIKQGQSFGITPLTYYVSTSGNNGNTGLSPDQAWKTLAYAAANATEPGYVVALKKGDTWRETLTMPRSGSAGDWFTFTSYGIGAKPKILGSDISTWSAEGHTNIWVCAATVTDPTSIGGATYGSDLFFDASGVITQGLKKIYTSDFSNLTAEYHWTYNGGKVYVYAASDPDSRYTTVEIPQRTIGIDVNGKEYIEINGIEIRFFCQFGVRGVSGSATDLSFLTIKNCDISWSGLITPNTATDRDNCGIHAAYSDMTIQNCVIHDMGRRAISIYNYGSGYTTTNIIVEGCTLYKCYHTTGVDISCGNGTTADFDGIIIRRNLIYDAVDSYNYGSELMNIESYYSAHYINNIQIYYNILVNPQNSGIHLYGIHGADIYNNTFYGHNNTAMGNTAHIKMTAADCTDIVIKNNIFYTPLNVESNSRGNALYTSPAQTTANITMDYNIYYRVNASYRIIELKDGVTIYHYNDIANIRSGEGWETHGQTIDPIFVSSTNYHLQAGSPCINAGVNIPTIPQFDYDNVAVANPPEIGAYEYV